MNATCFSAGCWRGGVGALDGTNRRRGGRPAPLLARWRAVMSGVGGSRGGRRRAPEQSVLHESFRRGWPEVASKVSLPQLCEAGSGAVPQLRGREVWLRGGDVRCLRFGTDGKEMFSLRRATARGGHGDESANGRGGAQEAGPLHAAQAAPPRARPAATGVGDVKEPRASRPPTGGRSCVPTPKSRRSSPEDGARTRHQTALSRSARQRTLQGVVRFGRFICPLLARPRVTEHASNCRVRTEAWKAIRINQPTTFSHPEIVPRFPPPSRAHSLSVEPVLRASNYPLDLQKSLSSERSLALDVPVPLHGS